MSDYKYISQELVTRYAVRKALFNKLRDWLEKKREHILSLMDKGYRCPKSGPWVLEAEPQEGTPAYKQLFIGYVAEQLLPKYNGDQAVAWAMAEREVEALVASAPRKSVVHLESKRNPLYKKEEIYGSQVA